MADTGWLAPVERAFEAAHGPIDVYFRDDDAGWADAELLRLLDVFAGHGIPVDVAAIPAAVGRALGAELAARARDGAIGVHQHGFAHTNHEADGRKCEFGPSRSLAQQADDIAAGREVLAERLEGEVDAVFTPPWNRCTDATARALLGAGIEVLSRDAGAGSIERAGLTEVPVTHDWFGHTKGVRWSRHELADRLAGAIGRGEQVGVMLHHAVMDDDDLDAVDALLAVVARRPEVHPTTILERARARQISGLPR